MTPQEAFRSALDNLAAHKLRSALTMLGMIFGVGAVIAMLSIGAGAERQALAMHRAAGAAQRPGARQESSRTTELEEIRQKSLGVSQRDAAAIAEAVPGVELVAPRIRIEPYKVLSARRQERGAAVFGVARAPGRPGPPDARRGALPRRARRAQPRPGLRHRPGRAARPLRLRPGAGPAGQGQRRLARGGRRAGGRTPRPAAGGGPGAEAARPAASGRPREIYLPVTTAERKFEHPAPRLAARRDRGPPEART